MSRSPRRNPTQPTYPKWLIPSVAIALIAVIIGGVMLFSRNKAESKTLISPNTYTQDFESRDHILLDVRTVAEFNEGHIEGATNIPVEELDRYLDRLPKDKTIVVYCRSGNRSATAATLLKNEGFSSVYDIDGGLIAWGQAKLPLVR